MISNILGVSWLETENQVLESGGPGGASHSKPVSKHALTLRLPSFIVLFLLFITTLIYSYLHLSPQQSKSEEDIQGLPVCRPRGDILFFYVPPLLTRFTYYQIHFRQPGIFH